MRKRLNKDVTDKVEAYLIKALSDIADLHYFPIVTEDEKKVFARQFNELSSFLATWGLSEHYIRRIKRRAIYNPIEELDEKSLMLEKVRNGKKSRIQLDSDVIDYIEESLMNALYELSGLYFSSLKKSEGENFYLRQYGELYVFLSHWGAYHQVDWIIELPDDVMSEFIPEARARDQARTKEKSINIIQKAWNMNIIQKN